MSNLICKTCGTSDADVVFRTKTRCVECFKKYHKACMEKYRKKNHEKLRDQSLAYWHNPVNKERKKKRAEAGLARISVRKSIEKTPESFLRYLLSATMGRIRSRNNDTAKFNIALSLIDLLAAYKHQRGKCALSGVQMEHKIGMMQSISIDRIKSEFGYTRDNVQLVCQFINLGKRAYSNEDVLKFLALLRS